MITDEMLAQAANAYVQIMVDHIPDSPEYIHSFSARFERRMRKIIRRGNHPVLYRTMRAAGYAVAVLVISFLTLMAANPSARAAVMDWIREMYGTYSHNYFNHNYDADIHSVNYELGYIPEGFIHANTHETPNNIMHTFSRMDNTVFFFSYSTDPYAIEYFSELDDYTSETVIINNQYATYLYSNNPQIAPMLQLIDSDSNSLIVISGFIEKDEMINIAKSIKKINN